MGYFDRVTVSLHILYTANQETEGSQDRLTVYVIVVSTSKPVENLGENGLFDRVTVSLHILYTANQETEVLLSIISTICSKT